MALLKGKTAFVTGGARGIGGAIVRRLASEGANVGINYARSADRAEALAADILGAGGHAFIVQGDVACLEDLDRMHDAIKAETGGIDILVNNAGRSAEGGNTSLAQMLPHDYDYIFALNTRGVFFCTQKLLPLMRDEGRIINFSSTGSFARVKNLAAYAGSKAAVEAFTRVWATELAPRRITVNAILPGMIDTDLISNNMGEAVKAKAASHHPWGRIGQPEDMANIVAFLAGPDSLWVNGQTIVANGGI